MKWSPFAERSAPVWKSQVSIESVPPYWGWWIYSCFPLFEGEAREMYKPKGARSIASGVALRSRT